MSSDDDCKKKAASDLPESENGDGVSQVNYKKKYSISSTTSQRSTLHKYLVDNKYFHTIYAREELGIMHPVMRVLELEKSGLDIEMDWVYATDATGVRHRVAQYHMLPERQGRLF